MVQMNLFAEQKWTQIFFLDKLTPSFSDVSPIISEPLPLYSLPDFTVFLAVNSAPLLHPVQLSSLDHSSPGIQQLPYGRHLAPQRLALF